jgi:hypothetical protein
MSDTNLDLSTVLKFGKHEVMLQDVSPKGLLYLVQYGFKQSMQDSIAGYAKKLAEEGKPDDAGPYTEAEIAELVAERQADRFDDIVSGEVGTRAGGGPRLSGIEKIMRDMAKDAIKAAVVAKGVKMPTGDTLAKFIDQYIAKHDATLRPEAQRRLDLTKAGADTDLLAELTA